MNSDTPSKPSSIKPTKLSTIKANPTNPRIIKDDKFQKLVKSIQDFPEMLEARPIVVNPDMIVLGGNMRLKACKAAGLIEAPVYIASWEESKANAFIIKDNVGYGEWDWDILANEWDATEIEEWGLDVWTPEIDPNQLGEEFSLADGDKPPFQSLTFTLADEQAEFIKNALADAKGLEEFKYIETMGNDNSNGNALYLLVSQWAGQRT
jgi:hypothetical protein